MNKRFRRCAGVAFFITVFGVFGPGGLIMAMLLIPASMSLFPHNDGGQVIVAGLGILAFLTPMMVITMILYWLAGIFFGKPKKNKKSSHPVPSSRYVTVTNSHNGSKTVPTDDIIEAEWSEVN